MKPRQKKRDAKGFTLAETLMAVLILLMVSGIVAAGIPVAKNAYQKVILSANAQTMLSTAVNALRDEIGTAWDVRVDDVVGKTAAGTFITYNSANTGARSKLFKDDANDGIIMLNENAALAALGVADQAAARPLVQDSATMGRQFLLVSYDSVSMTVETSDGKTKKSVSFTGLSVSVKDGDSTTPLITLDSDVKIRVF